jgi:predicted patatin/cPLA2 family phospholipase
MRAAYASGVLAAFEETHVRFDALYGTSAGGALVAWFAAGQARYATETWKYAADRRFFSYRRLLRGGPILDHDRLFRDVYEREHPLNVEAVMRSPAPVIVPVTDADSGAVRYVDVRAGPVLGWLRATGLMPLGLGPAVQLDGRRYVDGGVADPVPVRKAIEDGHRHIVVVANRALGERRHAENSFVVRLIGREYPMLQDLVARHHLLADDVDRLVKGGAEGVRIEVVRPGTPTGVGRFTRDVPRLLRAVEQGRLDGRAFAARR